jgi:hypothetical protein
MRIKTTVAAVMTLALLWTAPAFAQSQHVVPTGQLRQAIVAQAQADAKTRATVRRVLNGTQAQNLAASLGVDLSRADAAINSLSRAQLDQLAAPVQQADAQLAGGANNTIIISTTTILLILIIVILLVN